jgi:hypothetical protein
MGHLLDMQIETFLPGCLADQIEHGIYELVALIERGSNESSDESITGSLTGIVHSGPNRGQRYPVSKIAHLCEGDHGRVEESVFTIRLRREGLAEDWSVCIYRTVFPIMIAARLTGDDMLHLVGWGTVGDVVNLDRPVVARLCSAEFTQDKYRILGCNASVYLYLKSRTNRWLTVRCLDRRRITCESPIVQFWAEARRVLEDGGPLGRITEVADDDAYTRGMVKAWDHALLTAWGADGFDERLRSIGCSRRIWMRAQRAERSSGSRRVI